MYKNILDYFESTVLGNTEKKAVIYGERSITFGDLAAHSKAMSTKIMDCIGNVMNRPIAVLLPKCIEIIIMDLAVTYSANIFTNLDIKTPAGRIGNILEAIKPIAVITTEKYRNLIDKENTERIIINIDEISYDKINVNADELECRRKKQIDTDPFCIINTSGSTGTPKGVVLNHKSFFDFIAWSSETFQLDGTEVIGALSPVVFDIYDFEICLMMTKGATIVLLDGSLAAFPARLLTQLNDFKVNFLFWVPTIMVNIANMDLIKKIPLPYIKTVWFAGEVFPTKQFNYWRKELPQATFANLYGPIEITLDCIYYKVERDFQDDEPLPIGYPCNNTDILLLDENNQLCQMGEEGEICVRGTSLAMGYYNNPEKTAAVFTQNPLNPFYPELIYRTGDIAYVNELGEMCFKGRKDNLIKHQGYRIELGEIEHVVVNHLKLVKNCCVVYDKKKKEIVLIYESSQTTEIEIRKELGKVFPRYMIPTIYMEVEELPRNRNGKIDRLVLNNRIN